MTYPNRQPLGEPIISAKTKYILLTVALIHCCFQDLAGKNLSEAVNCYLTTTYNGIIRLKGFSVYC